MLSVIVLFPLVAIKVEKKDGEAVNYGKMKVKDLKKILSQRGVSCNGCSEKSEFVKRCQDTEGMQDL